MRISDAEAEDFLDSRFGSGSPTTWYAGMLIVPPDPDGTGYTEPAGGSYARVPKTNNNTNFADCVSGSRTKKVSTTITFPTATADWSPVCSGIGWFTGSSGGVCHFFEPFLDSGVPTPRPVLNGNTASFAADGIQISVIAGT